MDGGGVKEEHSKGGKAGGMQDEVAPTRKGGGGLSTRKKKLDTQKGKTEGADWLLTEELEKDEDEPSTKNKRCANLTALFRTIQQRRRRSWRCSHNPLVLRLSASGRTVNTLASEYGGKLGKEGLLLLRRLRKQRRESNVEPWARRPSRSHAREKTLKPSSICALQEPH